MLTHKTPLKASTTNNGRVGAYSTSMKSSNNIIETPIAAKSFGRAFTTVKKLKESTGTEAKIRVVSVFNPIGADSNTDNIQKLVSLCESKGIEVFKDKSNSDIFKGICNDNLSSSFTGDSTFLAFGPTGSGKSYLFTGRKDDPGLLVKYVEEQVKAGLDVSVKCFQYTGKMQVYDESLREFMNMKDQLMFKDTMLLQPISLTKENYGDVISNILAARPSENNGINKESSRSFAIFKVLVKENCKECTTTFIDMAGSERDFDGKSDVLVKQQNIINSAISAFTNVLKQINDGQNFISFRDNTLTSFLRKVLEESKITLILLISPWAFEESQRTINFGADVSNVKTMVVSNNVGNGVKISVSNGNESNIGNIFSVVKSLSPSSQLLFRKQYDDLFGHSKNGHNSSLGLETVELDSHENENKDPQMFSSDQTFDNTYIDLELDLQNRNPQVLTKKPRRSELQNLTRATNNAGPKKVRVPNLPRLRSDLNKTRLLD